ncbi:glycosyltransferase [Flavobacterium galactosidilyticum]|uniref:glycosyltransferase n=1 Tax=Flavobacterium galactosidilyticum TaxID=2893886 RepID=UPI001E483E59|nr:glycosyltransferase [Flavobacterium sp. F-340]UFH45046.1 glycosyltransferase [Flavobacterium sp. F-340]
MVDENERNNLKVDFFIIDNTPIGGVERVTCSLINLFFEKGIKVDYVISMQNKFEKPHFPYPEISNYINLNCSSKELEEKLYQQFIALEIKNLIFQGDNMSISIALLKAAKRAGVKAIPQYHGSPHAYLDKYISGNDIVKNPYLALKYLFARATRPFKLLKLKKYLVLAENGIACVSHGSANEIKKIFKNSQVINERVFTIYNPLHLELQNINTDINQKSNNIVYLSRLENKHKNSFLVVKAWNEIAHKYPNWQLDILGDGAISDKMKNYVDENKITNVVFHGMITEIAPHLSKSKISILTSNCEGLGMGILESICYKNAVVCTKSDGGITDLVKHKKSGLIVARNDHKGFAKSMEKLMNDEQLRTEYANESYKIASNFSDEEIIEEWRKRFEL